MRVPGRAPGTNREQLERMWCVRFCCREGALAAPLQRVVLMEDDDTRRGAPAVAKVVGHVRRFLMGRKESKFIKHIHAKTD